jgi:purine-binding chemotaxis protein CheW
MNRSAEELHNPDEAILLERARLLAREEIIGFSDETPLEIVEFILAGEHYAVEAAYLREVSPLRSLTPLPGTPPFVLGIINLRGVILSVLDIKKLFGLADKGLSDQAKVLVLSSPEMEFAILADAIVGNSSLLESTLRNDLPTLTGIRRDYLRGLTAEHLVLLDAGRLLADPSLIVNDAS